MLILAGTGINFDLTNSCIEELKKCSEVFIETYTNLISQEEIKKMEQLIGKKIQILTRDQVESSYLIEKAKNSDICLLASGDPLTATTHIILLIEAKEKSVKTKVFHNSSIYSAAAGKSGLQIYRFGKTATLVNPRPNYKPTSSLEIIRENISRNIHSLVLLDTEPKPMEARVALELLNEFEQAIVLSRIGLIDEKISFGKVNDLITQELGSAPFTIIIPAKLHPIEEEFLRFYLISR